MKLYTGLERLKARSIKPGVPDEDFGQLLATKYIANHSIYLAFDGSKYSLLISIHGSRDVQVLQYREERRNDAFAAFIECVTADHLLELLKLNPLPADATA